MKKEKLLILEREDVIPIKKDSPFFCLEVTDFTIPNKSLRECGVILFVDGGGQTKILKNRHGDVGLIYKLQ